ncbi:MAG: hypothetical protein ACTS42_00130 [Candidatus Hodgkinia cicadicola]
MLSVYFNIVVKYLWVTIIEIVDCHIGRYGGKCKRRFVCRGRIVFISHTKVI